MTVHSRTPKYPDWKITTPFYAALHMVDGYFERNGIELSENHRGRIKLVGKKLPLVCECYDKLYQLSLDARYKIGNRLKDAKRKVALKCFLHIRDGMGSM